jgi:hypothetical protein
MFISRIIKNTAAKNMISAPAHTAATLRVLGSSPACGLTGIRAHRIRRFLFVRRRRVLHFVRTDNQQFRPYLHFIFNPPFLLSDLLNFFGLSAVFLRYLSKILYVVRVKRFCGRFLFFHFFDFKKNFIPHFVYSLPKNEIFGVFLICAENLSL